MHFRDPLVHTGEKGLTGDTGSKGETGSDGVQGPPGNNTDCIIGKGTQNLVGMCLVI